jgi:phosphoglycerate dehydrogenase-like enzyme
VALRVHYSGDPIWSESFSDALSGIAICSFGEEVPDDLQVLVKGRPNEEELAATNLKAVVVPFAGIPIQTRELLKKRPRIELFNLHHNAADTAEMAIALYMAVAKRLIVRDAALREGQWSEDTFVRGGPGESVRAVGKRALILGYGEIGKRISNVCRALEMDVRAIKRSGPFDDRTLPIEQLDELLKTADALFVALPLTPQTENLMDARRIQLLPPTAIISNIARAAIFDERALFEALKSKQIVGAGLDVWWNYPTADEPCLPSNYPFQNLPNVVMTPHVGGSSDASEEHRRQALIELIKGIANGTAKAASAELGY